MGRGASKGHLWPRGNTFYAIWYRNGHRFCENTHKSDKAEAQAEMERMIADCEAGNFAKPDKTPPTLIAMLNEALRMYKRKERKSLEHVERHAKRLRKGFPGRRADEITSDHVNDYIETRLEEEAANATINRELAFLRFAYKLAGKTRKLKAEVIPHIEMLPENNRRTGFFEQEHYEAVLKELPEYVKGVLTLGYWTGMRKAEMLGLRWEQVDIFNRLVFLERTKNGEDRTLPLNDELFAMMTEQAKWRMDACPFVFHRFGQRIKSFSKAWHTACEKAGCPGKLVHDLRRTGVRNLVRAGVPQSVAMKISGHKDPRIFERYNITDTRDIAEAMRKVSIYEQEKRLARAQSVLDVHASFTSADSEGETPVLPERVQ
ncbi:MAG: tyrosine-type recombinase/integrase [Terriglobia bacterium]